MSRTDELTSMSTETGLSSTETRVLGIRLSRVDQRQRPRGAFLGLLRTWSLSRPGVAVLRGSGNGGMLGSLQDHATKSKSGPATQASLPCCRRATHRGRLLTSSGPWCQTHTRGRRKTGGGGRPPNKFLSRVSMPHRHGPSRRRCPSGSTKSTVPTGRGGWRKSDADQAVNWVN